MNFAVNLSWVGFCAVSRSVGSWSKTERSSEAIAQTVLEHCSLSVLLLKLQHETIRLKQDWSSLIEVSACSTHPRYDVLVDIQVLVDVDDAYAIVPSAVKVYDA